MKVPFVHAPGDLRLDEIATPAPGPRDAVVRVATVGVCGSDLGYLAIGGLAGPGPSPMPLGHELSGTIDAVGAEVRGWAAGDRVILNPMTHSIGNGGPEGGFAERLLVRDVAGNPDQLLRVPDAMSFETAALVEPLSVSLHTVNRAAPTPQDRIALFGAGPIGLGVVALLAARGIADVVVFDPSAYRRERALAMGAAHAIDPRAEPAADALARIHGTASLWGYPVAATNLFIDMAGVPGLVGEIVGLAPLGARLVVTAVHKKPVTLDFQTLLAKEMTITTALGYPDEFPDAIRLLERGLDLAPMISHRFAGDAVMAAFAAAGDAGTAAKVLVTYAG